MEQLFSETDKLQTENILMLNEYVEWITKLLLKTEFSNVTNSGVVQIPQGCRTLYVNGIGRSGVRGPFIL